MPKEYLGDGVYVEFSELDNGSSLKLTTENGLLDDPSNVIFLEYSVMERLVAFYLKIKEGE